MQPAEIPLNGVADCGDVVRAFVTCQALVTNCSTGCVRGRWLSPFAGCKLAYLTRQLASHTSGSRWNFECSENTQVLAMALRNAWSRVRLWSAVSYDPSQGVAVLHKCANPVCCAQFRYLHQGKLFELEIQYVESTLGDAQGKLGNGKGHIERCWLCDQCAAHIALRFDRRRGLVMVSSLGGSEEALTTAIPQSSPKAAAGIARVLIRPLELDLTISPRRKATSELNIRRREIA